MSGPIDDLTIVRMAQRLGLSDDLLHAVWKHLDEPCVWRERKCPAWLSWLYVLFIRAHMSSCQTNRTMWLQNSALAQEMHTWT